MATRKNKIKIKTNNEKNQYHELYDAMITNKKIRSASERFFKRGDYRNSVLDAMIAIEEMVKEKAQNPEVRGKGLIGAKLMRYVFDKRNPILFWRKIETQNDRDELEGYQNIMAGAMTGIRNPKAHSLKEQTPKRALELLTVANLLADLVDSSILLQNINNKEKRIETRGVNRTILEIKTKMNAAIRTMLAEIVFNDKHLEKGIERKTKYQHKAFWHSLRINRISSAVSSEVIDSLSPEAQELLSEYHEKAQRMNEYVEQLEGEQEALKIQKICAKQNPLLNDLVRISPILKSLLESG